MDIQGYKRNILARVAPKPENVKKQTDLYVKLYDKIWAVIDQLGMRSDVIKVQLQGSIAKGTDLAEGGSDMDIFIIFKNTVSQEIREHAGVVIGLETLRDYEPTIQNATSKYVEAEINLDGLLVKVQIVTTGYLSIREIQTRVKDDGTPIQSIGMERTTHHTEFMVEALVEKNNEVRILKQFMKNNKLYDSSMKSRGFSGYSTEVLIYYLGSFEKVIEFFANFKAGTVLGSTHLKFDNLFSLIDPIDPNRDLVTAFDPIKIARTVRVCRHFLEVGEYPPEPKKTRAPALVLSFDTTETNIDTLYGQLKRSQLAIYKQLDILGFPTIIEKPELTDGTRFALPRLQIKINGNRVTLYFGFHNTVIPNEYEDRGIRISPPSNVKPEIWIDNIINYVTANPESTFVRKENMLCAIKQRRFTRLKIAAWDLLKKNNIGKVGISENIQKDISAWHTINTREHEFENIV